MKPIHRDFAIREIGCIASRRWAEMKGRFLSVPILCEKHHLNEGDQAGRKRRGEKYTVGLSPWSHRGICGCTGAQRDCAVCRDRHGPSLYHHGKEFFQVFGSGDELLEYQNELLRQWELGVIG